MAQGVFPGQPANPFAPFHPAGVGLAGMQTLGESLVPPMQFPEMQRQQLPGIAYSASRNEMYVQGTVFSAEDATAALQSEALLAGPSVGLPTEGDWQPLPFDVYQQYLESIRNPTRSELFGKNFAIGMQQLKQLGGSALQLAGAEGLGGRIVESAEERIQQLAPFQRQFTDVEFGSAERGVIDWFVATLGTQGPMLLQSVASGLAGAAAGSAVAGPGLGTAGGFLAGVLGRKAFKDKVLKAAGNYRKGAASADDLKLLKNASALTGAVIGAYGSSYVIGAGDIYGEMREQGATADDAGARLSALAGAVPYALLETIPEFFVAGRILGAGGRAALPAGASKLRRGAEYGLIRPAQGAVAFGLAEGLTELGQEGLVMGLSGQDLTSGEAVKRFINAFAAGVAVGGVMGGVVNLRSRNPDGTPAPATREPTNLLDNPEPEPKPELSPALPVGDVTREGMLGRPDFVAGEGGVRRSRPSDRLFRGEVAPGQFGGDQGVFDLGEPAPISELQQRSRQLGGVREEPIITIWNDQLLRDESFREVYNAQTGQMELQRVEPEPTPVTPDVRQSVLQFAPEAPSGVGFTEQQPAPNTLMAQQMQAAQRRQQEELAHQQRAQQIAEQEAAQRRQQENLMLAQRQLQIAEQQVPQEEQEPMPMRPAGPTQPVQLPTPQGEPSMAALRAAGVKTKVPLTEPKPRATKTPGARGLKKGAKVAEQQVPQEEQEPMPMRPAGPTQQSEPAAPAQAQPKAKVTPLKKPKAAPAAASGAKGAALKTRKPTKKEPTDGVQEAKAQPETKTEPLKKPKPKAKPKAEALKKPKAAPAAAAVPASESWDAMDTGVAWSELTPAQQKRWDKSDRTRKTADTLAVEAKPKLSPQEAWNRELPPGEVRYVDLPQAAKDRWEASDRSGVAQIVIQQDLKDDKFVMTENERFNYNVALANEAIRIGNNALLTEALLGGRNMEGGIVETAYFTAPGPNTNSRITEARDLISQWSLTESQQAVFADAFVLMAEGRKLDTYTKGGKEKGVPTAWFSVAKNSTGLVQRLAQANVVFQGLPQAEAQALLDAGMLHEYNLPESTVKAIRKSTATPAQKAGAKPQISAATRLADAIQQQNTSTARPSPTQRQRIIDKLAALWAEVRAAKLDTSEADAKLGHPLRDFFTSDGLPIINKISGMIKVSNKRMTKEQIKEAEQLIRTDAELARQAMQETSVPTIDDWDSAVDDSGRWRTADGAPIKGPLPVGRIRIALARFLGKLVRRPTVMLYKNQADLKTRNPALYQQAVASRPQGDFDTTAAVGFSFAGNKVIIFTDRVVTEDHLNFVLAHETLGHFGLRGIIPAKQFDALMNDIYARDETVRAGVDAAMQTREMSRAEAVEEYLSDYAATLDVSLIARVWNSIKNALNKLGVKFADDAARYWINQARRYVRNGETSAAFVNSRVGQAINNMEGGLDSENVGRYAVTSRLREDNIIAGLMQDNIGGVPDNIPDAIKKLKGKIGDTFDSVEKFKATVFSLLNFRARENPGLAELDRILRDGRGFAMSIKNDANEKMAKVLNRTIASFAAGWAGVGGITTEQTTQLNKMLYDAQRYAVSKHNPANLKGDSLITVSSDGTIALNETEINRIYDLGLISFEQAKEGYSYEVTYPEDGKTVTETVQVPGIPDLTEDSLVWRGYLDTRSTVKDVELQLLRARYAAFTKDRDLAFREIGELMTDRKLTKNDTKFLERMYRKYRDLWVADPIVDVNGEPAYNPNSIKAANDFLVKVNQALIGEATDRNQAVMDFFDTAVKDDIFDSIEAFKTRYQKTDENKFTIQNRLKDIIVADTANDGADMYTKTTLATGYAPVLRKGKYQIRMVATNADGKVVKLKQGYQDQLVFSQVETASDATALANQINKLFSGRTYSVEAYADVPEFEKMDVTLRAVPEAALTEIAAPPELNLNEFVRGIRQFSLNLPPEKLQEIIVALTRQNSSARNRLKRGFAPGADPNALQALSQHIESRASTAAKILMRPRINELMNRRLTATSKLWYGDPEKLAQLKANAERVALDLQASEGERIEAKRAYDAYNFQYSRTQRDELNMGNQYYNEAANTLSFLDSNQRVEASDFESGQIASNIRAYTSILQLGASIATGALNYIGAITNGIPYLATYNDKTAFGGGFGLWQSVVAFQKALSDVGLIRALPGVGEKGLNTAEFYDSLVKNKALREQYGLTEGEARFMAREIRDGEMIPALSNSLVSSARGRAVLGAVQKGIDGMMWTFNVTEQASRRGLGLAAYRLQYGRAIEAGMTEADAAASARDFAVGTLRFTVGDYSVTNRPPIWRSGVQSFLYIYKTFPTTSIQMLSRLPRKGQAYMLTALWVMGGIAAAPFAEDIEDLIDTIGQALGWRKGSIRAEIARVIDEIAPGMSPYAMRGLANAYFSGNLADRVSLSDFVPGTGILLAGANVGRELTDIGGPAASMLTGVASFVPRFLQATFTDRVTFNDAFRESPATMARAFADTYAYGQAGAVVDKRGYVVSPDMHAGLLLTRMMGFYPAAAAQQYEIIRASKRIMDYQRETTAAFRTAWVKAKLQGDEAQAQRIVESVRNWNEGARGTALEIRNFLPNSQRALREARLPAQARLRRGAPLAARSDLDQIANLLGYNDD